MPNEITEIKQLALCGYSSIQSITIHEGVNKIGEGEFAYCTYLASIYCKATYPPAAISPISEMRIAIIYVPTASVDTYKTADVWSNYADDIVGYDF